MPYYRKHNGTLFPGLIAKSEDIHQIQTNIDDAIRAVIEDQYQHTGFILGSRENDFLLSPAPKRYGRYIDTQNLVDSTNETWLNINDYGYRQAIATSKTSVYSIIVKLRNMYSKSQDVSFELWTKYGKIAKQTITVPEKTSSAEFEVVFNLEHFSTQHGRTPQELEKPDAKFIAETDKEIKINQEYDIANNPDNQSLGATTLYFVVKAIHKATEIITQQDADAEKITEETFMICADSQGQYGHKLEQTADDGRNYESTEFDLHFKDVYSNAPTYLCTGGEAVVRGSPVICNDTHVTVDGAATSGHTKSYIAMDEWGQLKSYTSDAYWGDESNAIFHQFPSGDLIIAIIYTYNGDIKPPKIVQDDNIFEDLIMDDNYNEYGGVAIRQRSHHERLRRLEKEMAYQRDITMPSRLKYNLTGEDIVDSTSNADNGGMKVSAINATRTEANQQLVDPQITDTQKAIDWSKHFIATDMYGNFIVKSIDAQTEEIPVTLKETATLENKTGIKLAQTVVASENIEIDRTKGIAKLAQHSVETTKDSTEGVYTVGLNEKQAKETEYNPWDDSAANRPETADIKPTERIFTTKKGVNGVNVRSSEYPAMTLYIKESITLKELIIPVVKFQNVDTVQFHIWKRQGPNNQHNTVWLEKLIYSSEKFSLQNAKTKDNYQILDEPFKIVPKNGLKLDEHQYIILIQIVPKSGDGSVFVETYTPKSSTDFLIRYHGSADCAHFRLKERYREVWYTSAQKEAKIKAYVNEYYKEGTLESGEVVWENSEPIVSVTPIMNSVIPEGCSIELQADVGNGWKTLTNETATKITGGTSSFKWRAVLKGTASATPEIQYKSDKQYAINFSVTKGQPKAGSANAAEQINNKNVLTTKTFYPGDILSKYIGDSNLNTCDKFSNYEWLRIYGSDNGEAKAVIDVAASDMRVKLDTTNTNNVLTKITNNVGCAPKDSTEYDIFTLYYADLTFDDFMTDSVDYSNYDSNIEYDEHNLRFKIDTDKAYNDDDVALFVIQDAESDLPQYDESKVSTSNANVITNNNDIITLDTNKQYLTVRFRNNQNSTNEDDSIEANKFIWKKTLPGDSTIDLSGYSALKIRYNFNQYKANTEESKLKGIGLYVSSAIEEIPPSYNKADGEGEDTPETINGKVVRRDINIAPETLQYYELEDYKTSMLEIKREMNGVTYTEYYYYEPDENGIWRRHQYHDIHSFILYDLGEFKATQQITQDNSDNYQTEYITISIDKDNDNFRYIKEIGLVALYDEETKQGIQIDDSSELQILDVKGVIQGYNKIYSAEKALNTSATNNTNIVNSKLYQDATGQISSITRIYYNRLSSSTNTQIGYINNESITTDANNFAIQFVSDTYIPKDSLFVNLCAEENGVSPIFTLNMPTLNHVFYDSNLDLQNLLSDSETSEQSKIFTIDNTKEDYKGAEISKINRYTFSTTETAATFPEGKREEDYTYEKQNKIEYQISIEPVKTTLNIADDKLEFNVYKQKVNPPTSTQPTETYGDKSYIGKIVSTYDKKTLISPKLQVMIGASNIYASYKDAASNPTDINSIDTMSADSTTTGRYGFVFDYPPGQYKVRVGFQGYSVVVDSTSTDPNKNCLVTYRSAETEFTINMYWKMKNTVNFAQIFKKINEEKQIKSISIDVSNKFREYMNTVRGTANTDADEFMHIFIKDMVLYEAEHIPLVHPNVRFKIYSKASDGTDTEVEAVGIRKVGAVIEYK